MILFPYIPSYTRGYESCAPRAASRRQRRLRAARARLRRDLRDNALESFGLEDFLAQALQLERLYAAARCICAVRTLDDLPGVQARRRQRAVLRHGRHHSLHNPWQQV
jgi:hypothetical protein